MPLDTLLAKLPQGGNLIATIVNPHTRPQMATVREGVMRRLLPVDQPQGSVERVEVQFQPGDLALTFPMPAPGFARMEILRGFLPGLPLLPAALSNPIYFDGG